MSQICVAALQWNGSPEPEANLHALEQGLAEAAAQGATVAVLPENLLCMGKHEEDKYASADQPPHWYWRDRVLRLGAQFGLGLIAGSLYCQLPAEAPRVRSRCWVSDAQGQPLGYYDKRHLFDVDAGQGERYQESRTIAPGDNPARVIASQGASWGLSVCYDLRFAEHYWALREQGAQVIVVPAAFTYTTGEAHWEVLLRARAIETQCYVVASNQCGTHASGRQTWGHSMIIDPWGHILAQAGHQPEVLTAALDLQELHALRERFPVANHRRGSEV
jgi:nitrilase